MRASLLILLLATAMFAAGCEDVVGPKETLSIVAGSEAKEMEHIIQEFADARGINIEMHYKGSVDIMLQLQDPQFAYDAVLPANSMWISLGDVDLRRVKEEASIMRSPVVLGVKKPLAMNLGWVGRDVTVAEILEAVQAGKLSFSMTSATQSNSGASAYMGLLFALAGRPDMLDSATLQDPELQAKLRELLAGVNRSSGSSGWLKNLLVAQYDQMDAMFNYESMVIAANKELVDQNKDPLYVVYPVDGQAIADSTLGFVEKPDNKHKKELFIALRNHLLAPDAQSEIAKTGFRTALIGMNPKDADGSIFNPDWGIDLTRTISPITWPRADVIMEALTLYQTVLRKPSYTVYLLDKSGSMKGDGIVQLKDAMAGLLDPQQASRFLLQTSERDVTVVIPFSNAPEAAWVVRGNQPEDLNELLGHINGLEPKGGTDIYAPMRSGIDVLMEEGGSIRGYLPAMILLTDGRSKSGTLQEVLQHWQLLDPGFPMPPVFSVTFGKADPSQLHSIADATAGRVFDGRSGGLAQAFRKAKGYN